MNSPDFDQYVTLFKKLKDIHKSNNNIDEEQRNLILKLDDIWFRLSPDEQTLVDATNYNLGKYKMTETYLNLFDGKSIPELESMLSENGKKFRQIYNDWMKFRINNPETIHNDKESYYMDLLDEFYVQWEYDTTKLTELDINIIEYLPTPYDFLYYDGSTNSYKSYIVDYPILKYFSNHMFYKTNDYFKPSSTKSFFGTDLTKLDPIEHSYGMIYAMFHVEDEQYINIRMSLVVEQDYKELNDKYEFVRHTCDYPEFRLKPEFMLKKLFPDIK